MKTTGPFPSVTELFVSQLEAEAARTRRTLERVPAGREDWKPHEKSMPLGRLAMLVARMPTWFGLILEKDELDLNPPGGSNVDQSPLRTAEELVKAHDEAVSAARKTLAQATADRLATPWRLLVAGRVVSEQPRGIVVRDTFTHLSHHRAQLTVYLRLNDVPVPALFGPSADENRFD
jgi:uncharacterized damage-inducible protein DinB